jgi:hypothetical protein
VTDQDQEALAIGRAVFVRRQRAKDEGGDADAIRVCDEIIEAARAAGVAAITPEPQPAEEKQP